MSRKHFIELAKVVREMPEDARYLLALKLSAFCSLHCEEFKPERFMKACGF